MKASTVARKESQHEITYQHWMSCVGVALVDALLPFPLRLIMVREATLSRGQQTALDSFDRSLVRGRVVTGHRGERTGPRSMYEHGTWDHW